MVKRLTASLAEAISNFGGAHTPRVPLLGHTPAIDTDHIPGQYAALREVPLFAGVLYYGLTTMLRRSTVGEEYCDIVPVQPQRRRPRPCH